jgi:hypothetical protein
LEDGEEATFGCSFLLSFPSDEFWPSEWSEESSEPDSEPEDDWDLLAGKEKCKNGFAIVSLKSIK